MGGKFGLVGTGSRSFGAWVIAQCQYIVNCCFVLEHNAIFRDGVVPSAARAVAMQELTHKIMSQLKCQTEDSLYWHMHLKRSKIVTIFRSLSSKYII